MSGAGMRLLLLSGKKFKPKYTDSFTLNAPDGVSVAGRVSEKQNLIVTIRNGTWVTQNRQLVHTGSNAGFMYVVYGWGSGDVDMSFDITSSSGQSGFTLRSSASNSMFYWQGGSLVRDVAGAGTALLGGGTQNFATTFPNRIRSIAVGPLILLCDRNGYIKQAWVDNTTAFNRTNGNHGNFDFNINGTYDNFDYAAPGFSLTGADSFDRGDNASIGSSDYNGGAWVAGSGGAQIVSKQAVTTGAGDNLIYQDWSETNGYVGVAAKFASSTVAGVVGRVQDASNYYGLLNTANSDVRFTKVVAAVPTYLSGQTIIGNSTAGQYNTYGLALNGARAVAFADGVRVGNYSVPLNTSATKHGFYSSGVVTFGNFFKSSDISLAPAASTTAPIIVFDGDSLTAGAQGSTVPRYPMPSRVMDSRTSTEYFHNWGISGQTLAIMVTNRATNVDPLRDVVRSKNVLVVWGGTNDISLAAATGLDVYNSLVTYCTAAKAAGWDKIVVLTCLPREAVANVETQRLDFNSRVRAAVSPAWDYIADVGADSTIGVAGAQDNTTYYQTDKIHMTGVGYDIVAGYVKAALVQAIGY